MPTAPGKEAPPQAPVATPEEAEAVAAEAPAAPETEPEVRPEELSAGIGKPVGDSAWPEEIVDELRKPLDPNRVRRRSGRGSGQFEYLAGHDVKRRANEIFGFGNWGHSIKEQGEIGAVAVKNSDGKDGFHVAYRSVVRVWIRHAGGLFETEGSGYGDGVEYNAAARLTACELALKESETDALKRAFTDVGDQFGLILYAKGDEKKRIERDAAASNTSHAVVRRDLEANVPRSWTEILTRFDATVGVYVEKEGYDPKDGEGAAWLEELVEKNYGQPSIAALSSEKRQECFQLFASALLLLETELRGDGLDVDQRATIRKVIASKFGGIHLEGPPWRLGPNEPDRPMKGAAPAEEVDALPEPEPKPKPSEEPVAEDTQDREAARDASGK